jgi:hypothetical protein
MKRTLFVTAAALGLVAWLAAGAAHAQESGVGNLRLVDQAGAEVGREEAPAGEKHFRLPSGSTGIRVAFDYEGTTATPVQVRIMGPSGTVLLQQQEEYAAPGTYYADYKSDGPMPDQEYVVNVYIGTDPYLADSLQLIVGEGEIPGPVDAAAPTAASATESTGGQLAVTTGEAAAGTTSQDIPGGPSPVVLALAGLGIVALALVVAWAAWSATRRA